MSQVILGHKTLKFIKGYYYAPRFDAMVELNNILENIISGTNEPLDLYILDRIQSSNQDFTDINNQLEEIILSGYEPLENYLAIEALEDDLTVSFSTNTIQYSIDNCKTWNELPADTATCAINIGERIYFKGNLTPTSGAGIGTFTMSKKCKVLGNCNSMLFGDDAISNFDLTGYDNAFYCLFYGCSNIIDASQLRLQSTTLATYCYYGMFYNCTSLIAAPELPATALADGCYYYMFYNCTSLIAAPELPATTLELYCYTYMFGACSSLVTAPSILPATTLATYCYYGMFYNCTSLVTAPELPATELAEGCYFYMFYNCNKLNYIKALFAPILEMDSILSAYTNNWVNGVSSTGTFVKNVQATWDVTGVNGVPEGWTVILE